MAIIYVVAHQVESNLIQPLVVARTVKLHPAVVAIGVVAVDQLFGFIGLLIAVPIIATVTSWSTSCGSGRSSAEPSAPRRAGSALERPRGSRSGRAAERGRPPAGTCATAPAAGSPQHGRDTDPDELADRLERRGRRPRAPQRGARAADQRRRAGLGSRSALTRTCRVRRPRDDDDEDDGDDDDDADGWDDPDDEDEDEDEE